MHPPLLLVLLFCLAIPGSISEGSRTTLFGSSTSVAVFSPITARRTTVERREGSLTDESDAGSSVRLSAHGSSLSALGLVGVEIVAFRFVLRWCVAISCTSARSRYYHWFLVCRIDPYGSTNREPPCPLCFSSLLLHRWRRSGRGRRRNPWRR